MTTTPAPLGTIWPYVAHIEVIDEQTVKWLKWREVATCSDTPNVIAATLDELRTRADLKGASYWVKHEWGEREYLGR